MSNYQSSQVQETLALLCRIHNAGTEPRAHPTVGELSWADYVAIGITALETMLTGPAASQALQDWRDAYARDYAAAVERRLTVRWQDRFEAAFELDGVEVAAMRFADAGWTLARSAGLSGPWV